MPGIHASVKIIRRCIQLKQPFSESGHFVKTFFIKIKKNRKHMKRSDCHFDIHEFKKEGKKEIKHK